MAISVSFNGSTIYKPGSYTKQIIDLGGNFPLGPAGIVAIFGEADAGKPGSEEVELRNNVFGPDQLSEIRSKYRTGNIVDAANFLFAPASDGAIPSGAQAIYIYKTNASVRASLALATSYGTLKATEYGIGGNMITFKNTMVSETAPSKVSSATVDLTLGVLTNGDKFDLSINGGALNTFTFPAGIVTIADFNTAMTTTGYWSGGTPSGISIVATGTNNAATITFALSADSVEHQKGYGRSFQLTEKLNTPLADLNITAGLVTAAVEPSCALTLKNNRDLITEEDTLGGDIVLSIGCDASDATAAKVTIDANKIDLVITGGTSAGTNSFYKTSYPTVLDLVTGINLLTNWTASISDALFNSVSTTWLDRVTDVGALSVAGNKPARIKKDSGEIRNFFSLASSANLTASTNTYVGLPDAIVETSLTNGAKGATSTAAVTAAFEAFTKIRVNHVVPLFSRDATDDISDSLTDASSTYTIDGIHQALKTHLSLMATTKKRSERQGYPSYKAAYTACKTKAADLNDARCQLEIQDVRQVDSQGTIKWFQPYALSCMIAGARSGSPIGTPMTGKYMNCSGLRHTAQAMTTAEEDIVLDFDPSTQYDDAIKAGITFLESPETGGYKIVVDNTTYGKDDHWVYNRANVLYAADILTYDFRKKMEDIYVGVKNNLSVTMVKNTAASILRTYLAQGITVSTSDAPQGFKDLTIELDGNIIRPKVTVKLVEGIDFILSEITIQRATASA
jgi:hypothetical protein